MTNVDQFESVFKAATKTSFVYQAVDIRRVLLVTDLEEGPAQNLSDQVRSFLAVLGEDESVNWRTVQGNGFQNVKELLDLVEEEDPDLICAYRHLHSSAWRWPFSLGEELDVLTQISSSPVLILPHPKAQAEALAEILKGTRSVMAVTNHLTGDHRLVNFATRFTEEKGTLFLTHIEDEGVFKSYMDVISKIPTITTESAEEEILKQLLKEPHDYIRSCSETLQSEGLALNVKEIVTLGHHVADITRLIEEHQVDLLVLNTKDEDQAAMHGLAYSLAVELRRIPLLML
jgi:nucleotide-binding universal stress UspA family protein